MRMKMVAICIAGFLLGAVLLSCGTPQTGAGAIPNPPFRYVFEIGDSWAYYFETELMDCTDPTTGKTARVEVTADLTMTVESVEETSCVVRMEFDDVHLAVGGDATEVVAEIPTGKYRVDQSGDFKHTDINTPIVLARFGSGTPITSTWVNHTAESCFSRPARDGHSLRDAEWTANKARPASESSGQVSVELYYASVLAADGQQVWDTRVEVKGLSAEESIASLAWEGTTTVDESFTFDLKPVLEASGVDLDSVQGVLTDEIVGIYRLKGSSKFRGNAEIDIWSGWPKSCQLSAKVNGTAHLESRPFFGQTPQTQTDEYELRTSIELR
jgi:hypothetical protein